EILQLWVNLPSRLKMTEPRYTGLQRDEIPAHDADDGRARIQLISGEWNGERGPIESLTHITMMTIALDAGGRVTLPVAPGRTLFLYVVRGEIRIGETTAPAMHLAELDDAGDEIAIAAVQPSLVLFGHGEPYREPVVAHGPFVMNTREEIVQAIRDYQAGLFG
ncbi:MAG TPA: pirin-like C-terminal cupin domain-containing protein, partial [Thermoanaerobaculia bacterium]|nr:pirin-like C-terminal cupin domain-containing protein [Thermoanaerobaculia bacterium]